ncbi:ABC transporter permease [uncultured Mucilaginibacter sp.]|uniref:ABC transporter permease n=1 Tax=uncultured Mucilaginibacter sp. TaxID=797541 RepID=UPI00263776F9|nr:ABC transporter permease [uncultured Mucilaginibacter sp.]
MLSNYFKTAWRNLIKNKVHSFINIAGLSVGIGCSLLILLWVQNELSVDAFHKNGARLYKVYEREYYNHNINGDYDTPGLLAEELKKTIPEVEDAVMLQEENHKATFLVGNKILKVEGTGAGAELFSMFSYPLLQGTSKTALSSTVNISISKKIANQFFGTTQNAMGKTIRFDNKRDFIVTAVFQDLPANASRKFDYAISWEALQQDNLWAKSWEASGPLTYLLLRQGANPALVDKKLTHFLDTYKNQSKAHRIELGLQKFDEVYLHNIFKDGKIIGGRIEYVHLFSLVAIFILLIACINFMNLTTARSIKRAREVGVRKAVGALRSVLIKQFIGESLMLTAFAVIVALMLMTLLLPVFNEITQKQMAVPFGDAVFWLKLVAITLITGLISGSYPALFLSSFNPVKVLKGTVKLSNGAIWFRKGLVVFQFVLSMVLIIGTIVVSKQVNFIQTRNLGYDRENLIYVPIEGELVNKYATWKNEALKKPGIQNISCVSDNPTNFDSQTNAVDWEGRDATTMISFEQPVAGYDFVQTMKLKLAGGRDFSKNFPTDSNAYLINETAAQKMGYAHPVERTLTMNGRKGTIIGVLKDFHFRSLHEQIQPLIMRFGERYGYGDILIRTQPGKTKEALASLEALCKKFNPQFPFSYSFSNEEYQKLYRNEQIVNKFSNAFAFLAIFISCLGLLGLVMFTAEQRTKEIGIRKVLGATVIGIVQLMSADFLKLVIVAIIIASPLTWWAMAMWLSNYAYKISISWWMFALAGALTIIIALITVSFQAVKAALANPVKSLRSE